MFPYLNSPFAKIRGISKEIRKPASLEKIFYSYTPRRRSPLLEFYSYGCPCTTGLYFARGFSRALKLVQPAAPAVSPAPQPPQPVHAEERPISTSKRGTAFSLRLFYFSFIRVPLSVFFFAYAVWRLWLKRSLVCRAQFGRRRVSAL